MSLRRIVISLVVIFLSMPMLVFGYTYYTDKFTYIGDVNENTTITINYLGAEINYSVNTYTGSGNSKTINNYFLKGYRTFLDVDFNNYPSSHFRLSTEFNFSDGTTGYKRAVDYWLGNEEKSEQCNLYQYSGNNFYNFNINYTPIGTAIVSYDYINSSYMAIDFDVQLNSSSYANGQKRYIVDCQNTDSNFMSDFEDVIVNMHVIGWGSYTCTESFPGIYSNPLIRVMTTGSYNGYCALLNTNLISDYTYQDLSNNYLAIWFTLNSNKTIGNLDVSHTSIVKNYQINYNNNWINKTDVTGIGENYVFSYDNLNNITFYARPDSSTYLGFVLTDTIYQESSGIVPIPTAPPYNISISIDKTSYNIGDWVNLTYESSVSPFLLKLYKVLGTGQAVFMSQLHVYDTGPNTIKYVYLNSIDYTNDHYRIDAVYNNTVYDSVSFQIGGVSQLPGENATAPYVRWEYAPIYQVGNSYDVAVYAPNSSTAGWLFVYDPDGHVFELEPVSVGYGSFTITFWNDSKGGIYTAELRDPNSSTVIATDSIFVQYPTGHPSVKFLSDCVEAYSSTSVSYDIPDEAGNYSVQIFAPDGSLFDESEISSNGTLIFTAGAATGDYRFVFYADGVQSISASIHVGSCSGSAAAVGSGGSGGSGCVDADEDGVCDVGTNSATGTDIIGLLFSLQGIFFLFTAIICLVAAKYAGAAGAAGALVLGIGFGAYVGVFPAWLLFLLAVLVFVGAGVKISGSTLGGR